MNGPAGATPHLGAASPGTADPVQDPAVLGLIMDLNNALAATGEAFEGNVCYWDGTPPARYQVEPPTTDPDHVSKRANLAILARRHRSMLEIGLNAGHSALLCLAANPDLHYFGVDICHHAYTPVAVDVLKRRFGRRFHFWKGDSREVLPRIAVENRMLRFDLVHVDGGHGADLAFTDISNSLRLAAQGAELVLDDVNAAHLDAVLETFIRLGCLAPTREGGTLFRNNLHEVLVVC